VPRLVDLCTPKARMPERDGMPSSVAEWNQLDVATEMAYRRGFTHAMQVTINAMKAGHSIDDVQAFLYGPLWQWRHEDPVTPRVPEHIKTT